jgi:very-short-patch-repair endonuclease
MPFVANLFSILIVGAMIFSLIREKFLHREISKSDDLPYKSRDVLFTPAELNFLNTLEQSLNNNYRIYGKVRLWDIIEPKNNLDGKSYQKAINRISSKHVDFVICNARSLAIEMVIELDDSTHEQRDRRARDEFLEAALKAANVPIARFPVKRAYTLRELQAKLGDFVVSAQEPVVGKAVEVAEPESVVAIPASVKDIERCSTCGSEMKVREKKSGDEAGKKFWVCAQYPECKNVEPYVEAKWL